MEPMTGYERFYNTLHHLPVDAVPCYDAIWGETVERWQGEGKVPAGVDILEALDMDLRSGGSINCVADLDFADKVLEETEETVLRLDGNGAMLRQHKQHNSCPEHVDFTVKDRWGWEEHIKPRLLDVDRRRISFDDYRKSKQLAAEQQRFFTWWGVAPFEQMHPVCGHEYMLMGMALDPEWVQEMVMTYARFTISHLEVLFAEEGKPDAMFFGEDLGFKHRPFMSPAMYEEIMQPGHKLLFDWSHAQGLKVIVHSCGCIEPLVPGLLEAGMDCLQAMEVKAGMDMRRLHAQFGDKLAFFGNIDARVLISNDRAQIDAEMEAKLPPILENGGAYILMSDHSIPPDVDFETMQYFFARGREMSRELLSRKVMK
ncbi:MAG: uroporphyrinogen decarboxylase family protein [Armatimonadota bacterium]